MIVDEKSLGRELNVYPQGGLTMLLMKIIESWGDAARKEYHDPKELSPTVYLLTIKDFHEHLIYIRTKTNVPPAFRVVLKIVTDSLETAFKALEAYIAETFHSEEKP